MGAPLDQRRDERNQPERSKRGEDRRAGPDPGKAVFGDRRVDHPLRHEFIKQPLADLVGALIFADFLAHQIDVGIGAHLFGHRVAHAGRDQPQRTRGTAIAQALQA